MESQSNMNAENIIREILANFEFKDKFSPLFMRVYNAMGEICSDYERFKGKIVHLHTP